MVFGDYFPVWSLLHCRPTGADHTRSDPASGAERDASSQRGSGLYRGRQITVYRLFGRDLSPDPSNPSPNFMGKFYHNPRDPTVTMSPFDSVRFLSRF